MNSVLRYFARSAQGSETIMKQELTRLVGRRVEFQKAVKMYEFRCNFHQLLEICLKCRTIDSLHLQIGQKHQARDEKELIAQLKRVPFHNYWPGGQLKLKVDVQHSVLNSRIVERILKEHLQKMPIRREVARLRLEDKGLTTLNEVEDVIKQKKGTLLITSSELTPSIDNSTEFKLQMQKNYFRIYTPVNRIPMYKHGWKQRVGWAPIKESLAAAVMYKCNILKNAEKEGTLKIWDPFCGSGTLLLEALSMWHDKTVRQDVQQWFHFPNWPCFDNSIVDQYRHQTRERKSTIIGSDISVKAINNTIRNYKMLDVPSIKGQPPINKDPACNIYEASPSAYFIAEDFERVADRLLVDSGYTIVTNLPYGQRSQQTIEKKQLQSIYRRFNQMVKKHIQKFRDVFVIVPLEESFNKNHFLAHSDLRWSLVQELRNGNIKVGVYQLVEGDRQIVQHANQYRVPAIKQENSNPKTQEIVTELPKHLVPKKPRRAKLRVLWRRRVHQLSLAYQRHMERRLAIKNINDYRAIIMRQKMKKRGEQWKRTNLGILGQKPEEYTDEIRELFEKKIVKAMELREQEKEKKKKKISVKTVRKW